MAPKWKFTCSVDWHQSFRYSHPSLDLCREKLVLFHSLSPSLSLHMCICAPNLRKRLNENGSVKIHFRYGLLPFIAIWPKIVWNQIKASKRVFDHCYILSFSHCWWPKTLSINLYDPELCPKYLPIIRNSDTEPI